MSQGGAITSAGRYCLTNDIDAITFPTKTDLFTVEVVICLNGHKITGNGGSAIYIEDDYNASAGGGVYVKEYAVKYTDENGYTVTIKMY